MGRKEKDFDVQMAPNKEFHRENSRFCCDVKSSKCILGCQAKGCSKKSWFEILNMSELLSVPKASPRYPAKSQIIMSSQSQIAWPWEQEKSGLTSMTSSLPARTPLGYSLLDPTILDAFVSSLTFSAYQKSIIESFFFSLKFLHLEGNVFAYVVTSTDSISSRDGWVSRVLRKILST